MAQYTYSSSKNQYFYPPPNPLVHPGTFGYSVYSSAVAMTPSESQSSDSEYSSGMASPMSPSVPYSSTRNDVYHDPPRTGYEQYPSLSGQSSHARNSQTMPPQNYNSSKKKQSKPSKPKPYVCLEPGCEKTFTRPFDLGRHQKTTHGIGLRIDCPEGWCGRSGLPQPREKGGFSRVDHFYEHVKNVHRKEVVKDGRGGMWVKNSDGRMSEVHCTNPYN